MADGAVRERWSDERLLGAVASCDGDAFSVFYRRHLPRTVGYLLGRSAAYGYGLLLRGLPTGSQTLRHAGTVNGIKIDTTATLRVR